MAGAQPPAMKRLCQSSALWSGEPGGGCAGRWSAPGTHGLSPEQCFGLRSSARCSPVAPEYPLTPAGLALEAAPVLPVVPGARRVFSGGAGRPPPALAQVPALEDGEVRKQGVRAASSRPELASASSPRAPLLSASAAQLLSPLGPLVRVAPSTGDPAPSDNRIHYLWGTPWGKWPGSPGVRSRGRDRDPGGGLPGDLLNPLPFADSRRRPWEGEPPASPKTWWTARLEVPASRGGEGAVSERLAEGTCLLAGLEVGWGRVLESEKRKRRRRFNFFSLPLFRKGTTLQGGNKTECKHKQPQKEAKKSEAERSKRNTVTKLSGFVTIALLPANEQRGGASRGAVLYNTLLRQDSY